MCRFSAEDFSNWGAIDSRNDSGAERLPAPRLHFCFRTSDCRPGADGE